MYCRELDDRRQRVVRLDPDQAMGVESPPRENSGLRAVVALEHSRHRGVVGHCLRERTVRVKSGGGSYSNSGQGRGEAAGKADGSRQRQRPRSGSVSK